MRRLIRIMTVATILLMPAAALAAPRSGGDTGARLAQMCEAGSRDITALPVEPLQRLIGEDADKRAALDALANAAVKAAQDIKTEPTPDHPARSCTDRDFLNRYNASESFPLPYAGQAAALGPGAADGGSR